MNIADLARVRDEDLLKEPVGQASCAGARALMESIMSEEPQYANAAVSVETRDDYLHVTITDPEADVSAFTEAFRAVGLDAEVKKVPVAPEDVGTLVGIGRPAAPGEPYAQRVQIHPVNGDDYDARGKPVAEVRAEMERRGMKITYVVMWSHPDGTGSGYNVDAAHIKDDWPVGSVFSTASDAVEVTVEVGPDVPPDSLPKSTAPDPRGWWED
ncbi:hypothetical protein OHA25_22090 [Nonomuraea sp. NBC_00507]|uniref:hypothetical protein n=1 Tax=Nonomuraea sp. NBC_00507 TaxID=2976002 RepID=UPI002E17930D